MEEFYNKDTVLGSAKWWKYEGMDDQDAPEHLESQFFIGNSRFGNINGRIIVKPKRHMLCVAPTRSGKGASLIIPNLIFNRSSTLVIDPKGELVFHSAKRRREFGQRIYVLDPFQEYRKNYWKLTGDVEELTNFNPFSVLKNEQNKDYIRYIAESLIILRGEESHWAESALEFTEGMIAYMVEKGDVEPSLPYFRSLITKPYVFIAKMACETQLDPWPEDSIARRKLGRFADKHLGRNKELCSIISTAITQTGFLDDQELREHLSTTSPGFSLDCLTEEGAGSTIYLVLPFDKMQTHGRWLRLIVSLAIREVFRCTRQLDHKVLFLLDEFGNIGPLPAITSAFTMGAGRQIMIWAFLQGLSQIKRDYPSDWEIFIGNCSHLQFFNIMDQFTAEYISSLLGTTTVRISPKGGGKERPDSQTISGSCFDQVKDEYAQYLSRELLQPGEIRRLPKEYGILINRHEPPILYKKIKYYEEPPFKEFAREDPYYKKINQETAPEHQES